MAGEHQVFDLAFSNLDCSGMRVHTLDTGDYVTISIQCEALRWQGSGYQGHWPSHLARELLHLSHALRVRFLNCDPNEGSWLMMEEQWSRYAFAHRVIFDG